MGQYGEEISDGHFYVILGLVIYSFSIFLAFTEAPFYDMEKSVLKSLGEKVVCFGILFMIHFLLIIEFNFKLHSSLEALKVPLTYSSYFENNCFENPNYSIAFESF